MSDPILAFDTLDDRREMHTLLAKLPPARRVAFLAACCAEVTLPGSAVRPQPAPWLAARARDAGRCDRADDRLTAEVYTDMIALANAYNLDLGKALLKLERLVRLGHCAQPGQWGATACAASTASRRPWVRSQSDTRRRSQLLQ